MPAPRPAAVAPNRSPSAPPGRWLRLRSALLRAPMLGALLGTGLAGAITTTGCTDESLRSGPHIDRAVPPEAAPGASVRLEGEGFGPGGTVALGGRALTPRAWGEGSVVVTLPPDFASGASLFVVVSGGRASPPLPFTVLGANGRPDFGRRFPDATGERPPNDFGLLDFALPDGGRPDLGPGRDEGVNPVRAVFAPDPAGDDVVRVEAVATDDPGFVTLRVVLPARAAVNVGGVALHLVNDPGLMRFVGLVRPAASNRLVVREIAPGRVALGAVNPQEEVAVLRFRLGARGEGRVDLPARHRTVRDVGNQVLPLGFAGGSLRLEPF